MDHDLATTGAVLLSGGTGRRLGGADKAALEVGGRTLLERAVATLTAVAAEVVVVGPAHGIGGVVVCREEPAGGGPAAALLAGVRALPEAVRRVVVLAVDMPGVTPGTLTRLLDARTGDGAVLVDRESRRQPLCAAYDADALRALAAQGDATGESVRRLLAPLRLTEVAAAGGEAEDVDTPADLARARERWEGAD